MKSDEDQLRLLLSTLLPAFEASLDPICLVNRGNQVIHANAAMRNLLKIRPKMLKQGIVFCDILKMTACQKSCQILNSIEAKEVIRLDETPAVIHKDKVRLILKCVPVYGTAEGESTSARSKRASMREPIGALISVRDTSGEVLLQAKYHKALQMLDDTND